MNGGAVLPTVVDQFASPVDGRTIYVLSDGTAVRDSVIGFIHLSRVGGACLRVADTLTELASLPELHAVWFASAGCLPDSEHPEFVGTLTECETYVTEHGDEYDTSVLYALTVEPLPASVYFSLIEGSDGGAW